MHIFKGKTIKNKVFGKQIIGIAGTHKGAGVTHLGLMLTTCLSEGLGLNTAYLHWTDNKDVCFLRNHFCPEDKNDSFDEEFQVSRAVFYPRVRREKMFDILSEGYDCIVMDFGSSYKDHREEFLRCDKKIIVSCLSPWKRFYLEEFIAETEEIPESANWIYGINHSSAKEVSDAVRRLKGKASDGRTLPGKILTIPYEKDPFFLSPDAMNFTKYILNNLRT
ncbi:hypothetical protein [Anaerocolumna chitinilytica]|uniref:ParA family protein n=1 Tax=Anaerocolumna chitinilytica TaxID=1727145 RepID=A0A7I8DFU6_9FIRM|nr:hypothetical protein [Anaerocolumna chitinilytica]BCJ97262.1 hypothetical protein bsdcttw_03030 [Anaerocolumna chitinilytica]